MYSYSYAYYRLNSQAKIKFKNVYGGRKMAKELLHDIFPDMFLTGQPVYLNKVKSN